MGQDRKGSKRGRHARPETEIADLRRQLAKYEALQILFDAGLRGAQALGYAQKVLRLVGLDYRNPQTIRQIHRRVEKQIEKYPKEELAAQLEGCVQAYLWLLEQEIDFGLTPVLLRSNDFVTWTPASSSG